MATGIGQRQRYAVAFFFFFFFFFCWVLPARYPVSTRRAL
jgi:hypothetical protein